MYWSRSGKDGKVEIDFAIDHSQGLVLIEVNATVNWDSRSLRSYVERFHWDQALGFSFAHYRCPLVRHWSLVR